MKHYVLCFSYTATRICLIRKTKPEWQKGKFNVPGGKIEADEFALDACVREFKEETGIDTYPKEWKTFATFTTYNKHQEGTLFCFVRRTPNGGEYYRAPEGEEVEWIDLDKLEELDIIPNLQWLIPLAITQWEDKDNERGSIIL